MNNTELKSKIEKTIDHLITEVSQVRTGRASPSLIEDIKVKAYDSTMSLKEVGSITLLDPQNLVVIPWDKSLMHEIAKAIRDSDLKLNPTVDSDRVRVPTPPLTEERRKEFSKLVSVKVEEAKNSVRNIRQEAMKDIDRSFNDKIIGEDEKFRQKEEVEKLVKSYIERIEELGESKKKDLMTV